MILAIITCISMGLYNLAILIAFFFREFQKDMIEVHVPNISYAYDLNSVSFTSIFIHYFRHSKEPRASAAAIANKRTVTPLQKSNSANYSCLQDVVQRVKKLKLNPG